MPNKKVELDDNLIDLLLPFLKQYVEEVVFKYNPNHVASGEDGGQFTSGLTDDVFTSKGKAVEAAFRVRSKSSDVSRIVNADKVYSYGLKNGIKGGGNNVVEVLKSLGIYREGYDWKEHTTTEGKKVYIEAKKPSKVINPVTKQIMSTDQQGYVGEELVKRLDVKHLFADADGPGKSVFGGAKLTKITIMSGASAGGTSNARTAISADGTRSIKQSQVPFDAIFEIVEKNGKTVKYGAEIKTIIGDNARPKVKKEAAERKVLEAEKNKKKDPSFSTEGVFLITVHVNDDFSSAKIHLTKSGKDMQPSSGKPRESERLVTIGEGRLRGPKGAFLDNNFWATLAGDGK